MGASLYLCGPTIVGTGGAPGTRAPPTSWEGGQCSHSQSHAYPCCTRPDYEISHEISRTSSCKFCFSWLTARFYQETPATISLAAKRTPKGRGFNGRWAWSQQFYQLPPPTFNIFLRLCYACSQDYVEFSEQFFFLLSVSAMAAWIQLKKSLFICLVMREYRENQENVCSHSWPLAKLAICYCILYFGYYFLDWVAKFFHYFPYNLPLLSTVVGSIFEKWLQDL